MHCDTKSTGVRATISRSLTAAMRIARVDPVDALQYEERADKSDIVTQKNPAVS